jgi:hypothetical protein
MIGVEVRHNHVADLFRPNTGIRQEFRSATDRGRRCRPAVEALGETAGRLFELRAISRIDEHPALSPMAKRQENCLESHQPA